MIGKNVSVRILRLNKNSLNLQQRPGIVLAAVLIFSASFRIAFSQNAVCGLQLSNIPPVQEFRGLKLGMTKAEVETLVRTIKIPKSDRNGLAKTSFSPDFSKTIDKERFKSVRTVSLDFVDEHVAAIWIGYNAAFEWQTLEAAIEGLTTELNLPDFWTTHGRERVLSCADFRIGISMVSGSPSIRMIDMIRMEELKQRREKTEGN